jgi:hypothetical protein
MGEPTIHNLHFVSGDKGSVRDENNNHKQEPTAAMVGAYYISHSISSDCVRGQGTEKFKLNRLSLNPDSLCAEAQHTAPGLQVPPFLIVLFM